jgi:hypothetical protein
MVIYLKVNIVFNMKFEERLENIFLSCPSIRITQLLNRFELLREAKYKLDLFQ